MRADRQALRLLADQKVDRVPVPVEQIASKLDAEVVFRPFEGNISGMLFRGSGRPVIGVNSAHVATRQRFTIAHEIGHLLLHPKEAMILDKVVRVDFRDAKSSTASDKREIAANAFAAELLMPDSWVRREVALRVSSEADVDDEFAAELAKVFDVSPQAMQYRLVNLGIARQV